MAPRLVLITGANAGLGLEVVKALLGSSEEYTIIVSGRSSEKVEAAISGLKKDHGSTKSTLEALTLDIESDTSIAEAAAFVEQKWGKLDVLVNNAGAQYDGGRVWKTGDASASMSTRDVFNRNWDVNVTGTHLLTEALAPLLAKGTKPYLLFLTSGTASLAESENTAMWFNKPPPAGFPKPPSLVAYRSVKVGLNMLMREWKRLLENDGILVWSISPGFLATNLGGAGEEKLKGLGALDPAIGGGVIRDVIEGKRDTDAGKAIRKDAVQPW